MRITHLPELLFPCLIVALLPFSAAQTKAVGALPNTPTAPAQLTVSPGTQTPSDAEMAERVRQEFRHAWNGYKQYAWGHDALQPLSKSYHDWYGVPLHHVARRCYGHHDPDGHER